MTGSSRGRIARDRLLGVRMRTTLAATVVVAIALLAGSFALVRAQRSVLTAQVDRSIATRAGDLALVLDREENLGTIDIARQEESAVQIVDENNDVLAASENLAGEGPIADPNAIGIDTVRGLPMDPEEGFRVIANKVLSDGELVTIIVAGGLEPVDESVEVLVGNLWRTIPILLAVMALITWLIVGRALRPVEAIRAQVEEISDGQLDRRVPEPRSHDEIGRLARTMNRMLARLETAWLRQERFVADASHELRSPLTAMRSQLEVDARHPDTADIESTRDLLLDEIDQVQRLIDDLLFLARGDGGPRLHEMVDLDDLILSEVARKRPGSALTIDATSVSAGQVEGSPGELRRLIRNLLDNAVRHAHTRVVVALGEGRGGGREEAVIAVSDDGPGIPVEERERIFERFARVDQARSRQHASGDGSGLGLAIARDIVDRHDGTISIEETPGGGATFVVRLPVPGEPSAGDAA